MLGSAGSAPKTTAGFQRRYTGQRLQSNISTPSTPVTVAYFNFVIPR